MCLIHGGDSGRKENINAIYIPPAIFSEGDMCCGISSTTLTFKNNHLLKKNLNNAYSFFVYTHCCLYAFMLWLVLSASLFCRRGLYSHIMFHTHLIFQNVIFSGGPGVGLVRQGCQISLFYTRFEKCGCFHSSWLQKFSISLLTFFHSS